MFSQDRNSMRSFFLTTWRKAREGDPIEPLERQVAEVIRAHPEYHALLEDEETALAREFLPETGESNPFLHMSLHIAILEQVATDRPAGIRASYQRIAAACGDTHEAEHQITECLAQAMWEAQRAGRAPDESAYLECVQRLASGPNQNARKPKK